MSENKIKNEEEGKIQKRQREGEEKKEEMEEMKKRDGVEEIKEREERNRETQNGGIKERKIDRQVERERERDG